MSLEVEEVCSFWRWFTRSRMLGKTKSLHFSCLFFHGPKIAAGAPTITSPFFSKGQKGFSWKPYTINSVSISWSSFICRRCWKIFLSQLHCALYDIKVLLERINVSRQLVVSTQIEFNHLRHLCPWHYFMLFLILGIFKSHESNISSEWPDSVSGPSSWSIKAYREKKGHKEMIIGFQSKYSSVSCGNSLCKQNQTISGRV